MHKRKITKKNNPNLLPKKEWVNYRQNTHASKIIRRGINNKQCRLLSRCKELIVCKTSQKAESLP